MSLPNVQWIATPNKTDHLTQGYTSKVIYTYNYNYTEVADNGSIIDTISTVGKSFKGSNIFPKDYFEGDDGKGFKITMYFNKALDGNNVNITTNLIDIDNNIRYDIASPIFETPTDNIGGYTLCKYELYINSYHSGTDYYIEGDGSIIYSTTNNGTNLAMEPLGGGGTLTSGTAVKYALQISNKCGDVIQVISLMIEEIS